MDGAVLAFAPHVANGVGPVINVDGLGNRSLLLSSSVQMESNVLSPGTPYVATYRNDIPAWVLHALGGNAYGIPLAAGIDYWAATTPSSAFAFPVGQALSRSTYAALFALMGTNYGAGDGSTTFNLPDKVGRGSVMQDVGGARISTATFNRTTLGGVGGAETATAPLPAHTHANTLADPGHQHAILGRSIGNISTGGGSPIVGLQTQNGNDGSIVTDIDSTGVAITNVSAGSGTGIHPNVQPSIVCNYIIRVL
jgi:microcystin-dependent protein